MKKLAMLTVLFTAMPLFAGTITLVPTDNTNGTCTVDWTADVQVRAMGLDVDCTAGVIDGLTVDSFFDIFMDAAYDLGAGYAYGVGTPIADQDAPGELGLPLANLAISMGGLGGAALPLDPAISAGQIILSSTAGAAGTIDANALRGGIVDVDGDPVTIVGAPVAFAITNGPACWNFACFDKGDTNDDGLITPADVQTMLAAWTGAYDPCTDFNKDGLITPADVQMLLVGWTSGCN